PSRSRDTGRRRASRSAAGRVQCVQQQHDSGDSRHAECGDGEPDPGDHRAARRAVRHQGELVVVRMCRTAMPALVVGCLVLANGPTGAQPAAVPVLVELFTAEGCSSCPPADRIFEQMIAMQPAAGGLIVGLGEHVDYWDRAGWKDRFSSPQFTRRQQLYADRLGVGDIYTPQMVVDGQAAFVGSDGDAARPSIGRAGGRPHRVLPLTRTPLERSHAAVAVAIGELPGRSPDDRAELLVAVVEDRLRTEVKRGENGGRTLVHAAVARDLTTAGDVAAGATA